MAVDTYALLTAGAAAGAIFGGSIRSATETKARRGAPPWLLFGHTSVVRITAGHIFNVFLLAVAMVAVARGILWAADIGSLDGRQSQILGITWIIAAGVAKTVRYVYWKRKA